MKEKQLVTHSCTFRWVWPADTAIAVLRGGDGSFDASGEAGGTTRIRLHGTVYEADGGRGGDDYSAAFQLVLLDKLSEGLDMEIEIGRGGKCRDNERRAAGGFVRFYANAGRNG